MLKISVNHFLNTILNSNSWYLETVLFTPTLDYTNKNCFCKRLLIIFIFLMDLKNKRKRRRHFTSAKYTI